MDTSTEYINMCKAAKEIQAMWKPEDGDFFVHTAIDTIGRVSDQLYQTHEWSYCPIDRSNCTWLPRLDQLIELSGKHWSEFLFNVVEYQAGGINESAEIAALYEIMENKYGKDWNGEDWIKA